MLCNFCPILLVCNPMSRTHQYPEMVTLLTFISWWISSRVPKSRYHRHRAGIPWAVSFTTPGTACSRRTAVVRRAGTIINRRTAGRPSLCSATASAEQMSDACTWVTTLTIKCHHRWPENVRSDLSTGGQKMCETIYPPVAGKRARRLIYPLDRRFSIFHGAPILILVVWYLSCADKDDGVGGKGGGIKHRSL